MRRVFTATLLIILCILNVEAANPTLTVSPSSTKYVDLTNKTASGVINDPTDPLYTLGIDFVITDEDVNTVTITCTSSNTSVVPNNPANLIISGTGSLRNVKIKPIAVGYNISITIKATDIGGSNSTNYVLKYSASAAALVPANNHYHTHLSSGSTAIAVDNNYMFVGDDEYNELSLYNRNQSGMPVYKFDPTISLNLPDGTTTEVDIEASCKSPSNSNRSYWMGSMSNSKSGNLKPNRDRIFATDMSGTGASATLSFVGYGAMRTAVISWGDSHGYNLTASAASGIIPKRIDGFSLEGLEFAPDNTTLYLGFRTPFVPTSNRTKALICPVLNFETWFNNGSPSGSPTFGSPIELNLGGRGIRSMGKNATNEYIIVAGAFDGVNDFAVYKWTGNAVDAPVKWNVTLTSLSPEGIVEVPASVTNGLLVELVNDHGSSLWYNSTESKDLPNFEFQKFATTWVTINDPAVTGIVFNNAENSTPMSAYPNPVSDVFKVEYNSATSESVVVSVRDQKGVVMTSFNYELLQGANQIEISCADLISGLYLFSIEGKSSCKFVKR